MVVTVVLLGLVLVATVTDLRWRKIYNWTTYPGILAALGFNAAGDLARLSGYAAEESLRPLGWIGLSESLLGFLACGFLMLVCFVMFKVHGGDVKLIAMIGAFLGVQQGLEAMLWTFVLGGCVGVIILIWRVGPARLAGRVFRHIVYTLRLGRWGPLTDDERAQLQQPLFLAPSALAAVVIVRFSLVELLT